MPSKAERGDLPAANCNGCKYLEMNILGEIRPELDPLMETRLYSCKNREIMGEPKTPRDVCDYFKSDLNIKNVDIITGLLASYLKEGESFITYAVDETTDFGKSLLENNAEYLTSKYIIDFFMNPNNDSGYESIRIFSPAYDPNGEIIEDFLSVVGKPKK